MATHIVINPDLLTTTTMEKAFLDVAGEPASDNVTYTVYVPGAQPKTAVVPMNAKNFASSPDLFGLSAKKTALIVAATTDPGTPSVAVLRQHLGATCVALTVPSSNRAAGTAFNLPVSDVLAGGVLFVGNPGLSAATATVQYGSSTSPVTDNVTIPSLSVVKVKITQAEANLLFTVTNGVDVVVQAAIGTRFQVVLPIGPAV
jgi:hypothetical protein